MNNKLFYNFYLLFFVCISIYLRIIFNQPSYYQYFFIFMFFYFHSQDDQLETLLIGAFKLSMNI